MGLNIGGYNDEPNWPKMGPSLLIATCLIVAVRTANWTLRSEGSTASDRDLKHEIEHAAHVAVRVLSHLISRKPSVFPQTKKPWYQPNGEDQPE